MDYLLKIEQEAKRRKLSPRTIESYCSCVEIFMRHVNKQPKQITKKDVKDFLIHLSEKGRSGSTMNVYLHAIKFFIEDILGRRWRWDIRYSKRARSLPIFLSQQEISKLFSVITNKKHKLMVQLLYGAGLRVSELVHLQLKDLEIDQGYGWVRGGKGNKDRQFILPQSIIEVLLTHLDEQNISQGYIFRGYKDRPLSVRSIQVIIDNARKKANIKKNVHPHTLRHSFATHLIQNGYDLPTVQYLLGHESVKTTMVYVHMAHLRITHVKSPLEQL